MLVLTRAIGQPVRSASGVSLGHVKDLSVRLNGDHPRVYRLVVEDRHGTGLLPWTRVGHFRLSGIELSDDAPLGTVVANGDDLDLLADELLLRRDVLDCQIVDVDRHRMARVANVLLTARPDGQLEVAAVDPSLAAVFDRLGIGRLGKRFRGDVIDWSDLHLTSSRGHSIQLATTSAAVHRLDDQALAELLTRLNLEDASEVLLDAGPERAAAALARTHPEVGERLVLAMPDVDASRVIEALPKPTAHHYLHLLRDRSPLTRRRFFRLRGWRLNRPSARRTQPPRDTGTDK